jgi:hypothetical protein
LVLRYIALPGRHLVDIGKEVETVIVEPVETPVPRPAERPVEPVKEPAGK